MRSWLKAFLPGPLTASPAERLRGCSGALIGLLATGLFCAWLTDEGASAASLIAPLGASAVLLFAVPASPLAQPWSIIGGNILSALVGITCARWIPDPLVAAPAAVALAIGAMFALRCLHPPGGAIALTAVLGGPAVTEAGYGFAISPVGLDSAVLLLAAIAFHAATRRPYPHPRSVPAARHHTADRSPSQRLAVNEADLDAVLRRHEQLLDISRDDLGDLVQEVEMHAYRRRFGEITCAEIMSRDVVSVQFGTPLSEAWSLLRRHDMRALPVVDPARGVIGLVSDVDFLRSSQLDDYDGLGGRFRHAIRCLTTMHSERPEVVGQIMPRGVRPVAGDTHVASLVTLMADAGFRHVPVVDADCRLCGIIAQSDLIAALYRGWLAPSPLLTGRAA